MSYISRAKRIATVLGLAGMVGVSLAPHAFAFGGFGFGFGGFGLGVMGGGYGHGSMGGYGPVGGFFGGHYPMGHRPVEVLVRPAHPWGVYPVRHPYLPLPPRVYAGRPASVAPVPTAPAPAPVYTASAPAAVSPAPVATSGWPTPVAGSTASATPADTGRSLACDTASNANPTFVFVTFQSNASAVDTATFLKAYNVVVEDGPNADGYFKLRLQTPLPQDQLNQVIDSMKSQTAVVSQVTAG